jgi:amino acid transporter
MSGFGTIGRSGPMGEVMPPSRGISASEAWGYRQEFPRIVRFIQSFAVGFSQISITAGIFGTLGVVLLSSGPLGAWLSWVITGAGFTLVALVYATLSSRVPLTGHGYQYVSKIANAEVGWMVGWLTLLLTGIASMSVAYSVAAFVLPPLFGYDATTISTDLVAAGIIVCYAILNTLSTKITALINEYAVYTELIGMVGFSLVLFIDVAAHGGLHWSYLLNRGPSATKDYFSLGLVNGHNSAFLLAFVMPLFTLFGFEACANVAEELRQDPRVTVPRAIFLAEVVAAAAGLFVLVLVIVSAGRLKAVESAPSPLSYIMFEQLGTAGGKVFLLVVLYSVFACGLVLYLSTVRLVWAMARDQRFPGADRWKQVSARRGTPRNAAIMVGAVTLLVFGAFITQPNVWNQLIGATTFPPFVIYPTVLIVFLVRRGNLPAPKSFGLGRWDIPIAVLGLIWIAFGLSIFKSGFNDALIYTGGGVALGLLYLTGYRIRFGRMPAAGRRPDGEPMPVADGGQLPEDES